MPEPETKSNTKKKERTSTLALNGYPRGMASVFLDPRLRGNDASGDDSTKGMTVSGGDVSGGDVSEARRNWGITVSGALIIILGVDMSWPTMTA